MCALRQSRQKTHCRTGFCGRGGRRGAAQFGQGVVLCGGSSGKLRVSRNVSQRKRPCVPCTSSQQRLERLERFGLVDCVTNIPRITRNVKKNFFGLCLGLVRQRSTMFVPVDTLRQLAEVKHHFARGHNAVGAVRVLQRRFPVRLCSVR